MNSKHLINLFRASLIENKKKLFLTVLTLFGAATFVFSYTSMPEIFMVAIPLVLVIFAGRFFESSGKKGDNTHYHNLPVTNADRLGNALIYLAFVALLLLIAQVAGAATGRYLLYPLVRSELPYSHGYSFWELTLYCNKGILYVIATISVSLFGSIYYKSKALLKTFASGIAFFIGLAIFSMLLFYIALGTFNMNDYFLHNQAAANISILNAGFYHDYFFPICISVFFFALTYLRLRETEV